MKRLFLLFALLALPGTVSAQPAETVEYYGSDTIGSIRIAWDANGNVIGRQDYGPFGKPLFTVAGLPKEGFGGQEKDDEADQGYFHARALQFRIGRFGAPDPIAVPEDPQTLNRYSYALNNPETVVDPEGLLAAANECVWVEVAVEGGLSSELKCPLPKSGGGSGGGGGGGWSSALSGFWDFLGWAGMHTVDTLLGAEGVGGDELVPTASTAYKPSPTVEKAVDATLLVVAVVTPAKGVLANVAAKEAAAVTEKAVVATLAEDLAAAAARAKQTVGPGRGPVYGTKVHTAFEGEVKGLGIPDLGTEKSFKLGFPVDRGTPGSVRLDVVQYGQNGQVISVFDLKTGTATLTPQRIIQIQTHVGSPVPVSVIRP